MQLARSHWMFQGPFIYWPTLGFPLIPAFLFGEHTYPLWRVTLVPILFYVLRGASWGFAQLKKKREERRAAQGGTQRQPHEKMAAAVIWAEERANYKV
jgi:hypothetical protein